MKKVLLSLAAAVLIFTGCGKKVDRLEEFKTAFSSIKSAEVKMEAKMSLEQEGMNVDVNIPMTMKVSEKGVYAKLEKNTFIEQDIELYGSIEKEKVTLYIPSFDEEFNIGEGFMKLELDLNDESLKDYTEGLDEVKEEDVDKYLTDKVIVFVEEKDGLDHYQVVINDELLEQIAKDNNEEFEKTNMEIKFDVYIDSKTKTLSKIEFDFKDLIAKVAETGELEDEDFDLEMIKTFLFTIEFKNVNNTTVTIPQSVIDNATSLSGSEDVETDGLESAITG